MLVLLKHHRQASKNLLWLFRPFFSVSKIRIFKNKYVLVILAFMIRKLSLADHEFEVSLGCLVISSKTKQNNNKK